MLVNFVQVNITVKVQMSLYFY